MSLGLTSQETTKALFGATWRGVLDQLLALMTCTDPHQSGGSGGGYALLNGRYFHVKDFLQNLLSLFDIVDASSSFEDTVATIILAYSR